MIEDNIRLDTISNIPIRNFAQSLDNTISVADTKLSIINSDRISIIKKLQEKIKQIRSYLEPWLKSKLTYKEYYNMRIAKYPTEIQNLKDQVPNYRIQGHQDQHIRELVNNIERRELEKIYGSTVFNID